MTLEYETDKYGGNVLNVCSSRFYSASVQNVAHRPVSLAIEDNRLIEMELAMSGNHF